jgi:hypothetical protein
MKRPLFNWQLFRSLSYVRAVRLYIKPAVNYFDFEILIHINCVPLDAAPANGDEI